MVWYGLLRCCRRIEDEKVALAESGVWRGRRDVGEGDL